jgi:uncharacterized protein (DUF433 family)
MISYLFEYPWTIIETDQPELSIDEIRVDYPFIERERILDSLFLGNQE